MSFDVAVPKNCVECPTIEAKEIYFSSIGTTHLPFLGRARKQFLCEQLEAASTLDADLPRRPQELWRWVEGGVRDVGCEYRRYLSARKAGGPRQYFTTKTHALYFLKAVAPTKMVDGAWLYGVLKSWDDARFSSLVQTYIEELGEGIPDKNHVLIYKNLLTSHGCDQWESLNDVHYLQGAIQLALAHHANEFLPEVIGFNLGYEQLPLHLLITAYELNELGIDPYYFTLHVTVDNAAAGHAKKAVQAVFDAMPQISDRKSFFQRVINGYKLNFLGISTTSAIAGFDLDRELLSILVSKCSTGSQLHSDYCRVAGKTVNQWLSDASQLPAFLDSLQELGWIRRHEAPENSRFWRLVDGEHSEMFGVFNTYEKQVIYDWIAGDVAKAHTPCRLSYKARHRMMNTLAPGLRGQPQVSGERSIIRDHCSRSTQENGDRSSFNDELRLLEERLARFSSKREAMIYLTDLMAPGIHHTAAGLMATRVFTQLVHNR
jgi:hypothetical protein